MPNEDASSPAAPPGPYFSTWGAVDGAILARDEPPALGVVTQRSEPMPIGIAFPDGHVEHRKGPAVTFRLVVGKTELPGRWICVGRRFVPLGEAAEPL
jgi:hypothetical protein